MLKKISIVLGTGIIIMTGLISQASAGCMSAKGKITNNIQPDGNTMGVVALNLGGKKLKCALIGDLQDQPKFGIIEDEPKPNYLHTLVCDNKALLNDAQSQVTLKTWFVSEAEVTGICDEGNPSGPYSFSFEEISIPDPSTARGEFIGIDGVDYPSEITGTYSYITITGDYNCAGGITMKFDGQLCFSNVSE